MDQRNSPPYQVGLPICMLILSPIMKLSLFSSHPLHRCCPTYAFDIGRSARRIRGIREALALDRQEKVPLECVADPSLLCMVHTHLPAFANLLSVCLRGKMASFRVGADQSPSSSHRLRPYLVIGWICWERHTPTKVGTNPLRGSKR
jgi:hypothetical protein